MHADHGGDETELGDEVTVAHRVDRVRDRTAEAQLGGNRLWVKRKRGPRQRAGAHRRQCGANIPVTEPVEIPREGMHVLGELMAERHGLRVLQMGEAGRCGIDVTFRLHQQGALEIDDRSRQLPRVIAKEEPEVRGDLVVARASGSQLSAQDAETFGETPLKCRVNILVSRLGHESA